MKSTRKQSATPPNPDNKSPRSKVTSSLAQANLAAERANLKKSTPRLSKNYINKNCLVSVNPSVTSEASPSPLPKASGRPNQKSNKNADSDSDGYSSDEFNDGGKSKSADIPESIQKALKITASTDATHSPHLNQYMKLETELEKLKQMEKEFRRKQGRQYLQEHQLKNKLNPAMTTTGNTMTTATTNVTTTSSVRGKQSMKPKDKYLEKKESLKQWEKKLREINWRPLPPVQPSANNTTNLSTPQSNTQRPIIPKSEVQPNRKFYIPVLPMSEDEENDRRPMEETKDSFFQKMFNGMINIQEGYQSNHIINAPTHVNVTSEDEYSQPSDRNRRSPDGLLPLDDRETNILQWSSSHLKMKKNVYQNDDKEDEKEKDRHIPFIQRTSVQPLQPSTEHKSEETNAPPFRDLGLPHHEPFVNEKINDNDEDEDRSDRNFEDDYPMPYRDHNSDDDLLDIPVIRLSLSEKLAPLLLSASSKEFSAIPKESEQMSAPAPLKEVPKVENFNFGSKLADQRPSVARATQKPKKEEEEEQNDPTFTMRFDTHEVPKSMVYQRTEREEEKRFSEIPLNKTEEKLLYDRLHSYSAAAYLPPRSFYPIESNRYSSVYSSIEDNDSSGSEGSDDIPEYSALNAVYKSLRHKKDQEEKEKKKHQLQQARLKEKELLQRNSNLPVNTIKSPLSPQKENHNYLQIPRGEESKVKSSSNTLKSFVSPPSSHSAVLETSEAQEDAFRTSHPSQAAVFKTSSLHPDESMFSRTSPVPRPSSSSSAALKLKMEMMQELSKQDQIFQYAMELQELEKPTVDIPLLIATKQRHQQEQQRLQASQAARMEQSRTSRGRSGPAHIEEESNELLVSAESTMKQSERLLQLYVQLQKERAKNQADQKFEQVKSLAATLDNVRFINQIELQMNDPTARPITRPPPPPAQPAIIPDKVASVPLHVEKSSPPPIPHSPVPKVEKKTTETQTFESDILTFSHKAESTTQTIESPKKAKLKGERDESEALPNRKTAPMLSPSFIEHPINEEERQYKMRVFQINQKHKERLLWLDQLISMHLSTNEEANFERRKFESIYQMELQTLQREKYLRQQSSATIPHKSLNIHVSTRPASSNHDYEEVQDMSKRFHEDLWNKPQTEPAEDLKEDSEDEDTSLKITSYNRPGATENADVVRVDSDLEGFEEIKHEPLSATNDDDDEDDFDADDDKLPMDDSLSSSTKSGENADEEKDEESLQLQMRKSYEESQSQSKRYVDDDFEVAESTLSKTKEIEDISRSEEIEEEEYSGFPDEPSESEDEEDAKYEWTQSNRDYDMSSSSTQQRKKGEYDSDEFEIVDEDIEDEVEDDRYQWTQSNTDYEATGDSRKGIALSGRYLDEDFEVVEEEEKEISEEVSEAIEEENVEEDHEESRYNQNSFSQTNPDVADSVLYQEDFETSVKPRASSPTLKEEKSILDSMYIQDDFEIEEEEDNKEEDIPEEVVEGEYEDEVPEVEVTHIGSEYESEEFNYSRTKEESSLEYSRDVAAAITATSIAYTEPIYEPSYEKTFEDDFEIESRDDDKKIENSKPFPLPAIADEDEDVEEDLIEEADDKEDHENYDNESYQSYEPSTNALAISSRKDLEETNRYDDDFVNESSIAVPAPQTQIQGKKDEDEDEAEVMEEEFEVIEDEDYHDDGNYDDDLEAFEKTMEQTNNYENDSFHYESETFMTTTQKEDFGGFESMDKSIPAIEMTQPSLPSVEEEEDNYSDDQFPYSQTATQSLPPGMSTAAAVAATGIAAVGAVSLTQSQIYDDDDFEYNQSTLNDQQKDDLLIKEQSDKQIEQEADEIIEEEIPEDVESEHEDDEDYTKSFVEHSSAVDQKKPSQLTFDDESEASYEDTHAESEILEQKEKSLLASSEAQYKAESFEAESTLSPQKSEKNEEEDEEERSKHEEKVDDAEDDDFSATYEEEEFEQEDEEQQEEREEHDEEKLSEKNQPVISPSTKITKSPPTFEDSIEEEIDEVVEEDFESQHSQHSDSEEEQQEEKPEKEEEEEEVHPVSELNVADDEEDVAKDHLEEDNQEEGDDHELEASEEEKEIDYSELNISNTLEAPVETKTTKVLPPSAIEEDEEDYEEEFEEELEQEEEESTLVLPTEPTKSIEVVNDKIVEDEAEEESEIEEDIEEEMEILEKSDEEEQEHEQDKPEREQQVDLSEESVNAIPTQEEILEESEKEQQKLSEIIEDSFEETEYHQQQPHKIDDSHDEDAIEILKAPSTASTAPSALLSYQEDDLGELADLNPEVNFQSLQTRKSQLMEGMVALNTSDLGALSESQSAGGLGSGSGTGTAGGLPLQSSSMYFDYEQQKWMGNEEVSLGGFESSVDLSLPGEETHGIALDDEAFEDDEGGVVVEGLEDLALRERFPSSRSFEVAEMLSIDYSTETVSDIVDSTTDGLPIEYLDLPLEQSEEGLKEEQEIDDKEDENTLIAREKAVDEISQQLLQRLLQDSFQTVAKTIAQGREEEDDESKQKDLHEEQEREMREKELQRLKEEKERREREREAEKERERVKAEEEKKKKEKELKEESEKKLAKEEEERKKEAQRVTEAKEAAIREEKVREEEKKAESKENLTLTSPAIDPEELVRHIISSPSFFSFNNDAFIRSSMRLMHGMFEMRNNDYNRTSLM